MTLAAVRHRTQDDSGHFSWALVSIQTCHRYEGRQGGRPAHDGPQWMTSTPGGESNPGHHPLCRRPAPPRTPPRQACPRLESNQRHPPSQDDALSAELRGHGGSGRIRTASDKHLFYRQARLSNVGALPEGRLTGLESVPSAGTGGCSAVVVAPGCGPGTQRLPRL